MAQVDLVIDIASGEAVTSVTDTSVGQLPRFVQGDSLNLRIYLVRAAGNVSAPARIAVSGVTLQVALGTRVGDETEYYTQQFTWAASADLANPYWSALFPMNTDAITTLIGSASDASAWFEVKAIIDGLPTTLLSKQVTINAAVIKEGGLVVPPGLTPLATETANAMFLGRTITGPIVLVNETTGKQIQLYVGDDGTFHADPLT